MGLADQPSTSLIARAYTHLQCILSSLFSLQTRSLAAIRCVMWMQQWVSQPLVTSVSRNHKCGFNRAGLEVEQAVLQYLPALTHMTAETAAANYNCQRSVTAKEAGALFNCHTPQLSKLSSKAIAAGSPRGQANRNKHDYSKHFGITSVHTRSFQVHTSSCSVHTISYMSNVGTE